MCHHTSTPSLSTLSSSRGLTKLGDLILRWASPSFAFTFLHVGPGWPAGAGGVPCLSGYWALPSNRDGRPCHSNPRRFNGNIQPLNPRRRCRNLAITKPPQGIAVQRFGHDLPFHAKHCSVNP